MDPRTSRGFNNRNPGNMDRASGEPWQGEIRDSNDSRLNGYQVHELLAGRFAVFVTAEYGIRAMVKNLQAYARQGWTSVSSMIDHWAPPPAHGLIVSAAGGEANGEDQNDTAAYKRSVCKRLGVGPYDPISMTDYATVDAIIRVECGGMPYAGKEIEDGLRLAGIVKPATVASSSTMRGAATVAGATAMAPLVDPIASAVSPVRDLADVLAPMTGSSRYIDMAVIAVKVLLGLLALYGAYMVIRERKDRAVRDTAIEGVGL